MEKLDWEKEDKKTLIALVKFSLNFASYVREMNPELWKKAGEYAEDFTKEEGVEFTSSEEDENQSWIIFSVSYWHKNKSSYN